MITELLKCYPLTVSNPSRPPAGEWVRELRHRANGAERLVRRASQPDASGPRPQDLAVLAWRGASRCVIPLLATPHIGLRMWIRARLVAKRLELSDEVIF